MKKCKYCRIPRWFKRLIAWGLHAKGYWLCLCNDNPAPKNRHIIGNPDECPACPKVKGK